MQLAIALLVSYALVAGAFFLLQYPHQRFYRRMFPYLGLSGVSVFWLPLVLFVGFGFLFAGAVLALYRLFGGSERLA